MSAGLGLVVLEHWRGMKKKSFEGPEDSPLSGSGVQGRRPYTIGGGCCISPEDKPYENFSWDQYPKMEKNNSLSKMESRLNLSM